MIKKNVIPRLKSDQIIRFYSTVSSTKITPVGSNDYANLFESDDGLVICVGNYVNSNYLSVRNDRGVSVEVDGGGIKVCRSRIKKVHSFPEPFGASPLFYLIDVGATFHELHKIMPAGSTRKANSITIEEGVTLYSLAFGCDVEMVDGNYRECDLVDRHHITVNRVGNDNVIIGNKQCTYTLELKGGTIKAGLNFGDYQSGTFVSYLCIAYLIENGFIDNIKRDRGE